MTVGWPRACADVDEGGILTEDNVRAALEEAKRELGSLFGNSADNRAVGISGDATLVGLDGAEAVIRLEGRFWHRRVDVVS